MTVGVGSRCATASTDETTRGMTGTAISRYQARPSHNKFSVTKKVGDNNVLRVWPKQVEELAIQGPDISPLRVG